MKKITRHYSQTLYLFVIYGSFILVLLGIFFTYTYSHYRENTLEESKRSLENMCASITNSVEAQLDSLSSISMNIVYSNMGSRSAEGVYGYYGRPLAIMVRFPGNFFDTAPPPMALLNQSFLLLAALCILLLSMQIWKRRRIY